MSRYQDLQSHRNQSAVFLGKQSFMTVRDLLRWGHRQPSSYMELAVEGWALLAERLRKAEEREVVRSSLQKHCSGVKVLQVDYGKDRLVLEAQKRLKKKMEAGEMPPAGVGDVVWTPGFCRMVALIGRCVQSGEPALLVGETGGGKTMACQLLSWLLVEEGQPERRLRTLNCHQQTETSDFLGSLRPKRGRDVLYDQICQAAGNCEPFGSDLLQKHLALAARGEAEVKGLGRCLRAEMELVEETPGKRRRVEMRRLSELIGEYERIFEWADGVLVEAMRAGGAFLVDEISLAEDSVLERLNSVLEKDRTLLLAEKPLEGADLEVVRARESFRLFATMNPGGDFGKRELSPALRNRFTAPGRLN